MKSKRQSLPAQSAHLHCSPGKSVLFAGKVVTVLIVLSGALCAQVGFHPLDESEPIFTRRAVIKHSFLVNAHFETFHDMTIQEANHFNGNSAAAGFIIPLNPRLQMRLEIPYYTEGDARLTDDGSDPGEVVGAPTHIKGFDGVFELASVLFDLQLRERGKYGYNLLAFIGGGYRLDPLETSFTDKYNHAGLIFISGLRIDFPLSEKIDFLGNSRLTTFILSDDIGPSDKGIDWISNSDSWFLEDLSAALIVTNGFFLKPVVETRLLTDFINYQALSVAPELLLSIKNIDIKFGSMIGISGDADDFRNRIEVTMKTF